MPVIFNPGITYIIGFQTTGPWCINGYFKTEIAWYMGAQAEMSYCTHVGHLSVLSGHKFKDAEKISLKYEPGPWYGASLRTKKLVPQDNHFCTLTLL